MRTLNETLQLYAKITSLSIDEYKVVAKQLCKTDLFFLLVMICKRKDMINEWCYARVREVEAAPDNHLDLWSRGHYKDLAHTTPVFTPNGWTTHGELKEGDYVFSPTGKPVKVLATTETYTDSICYEIGFSDGEKIIAGAGHLWQINSGKIYTTEQIVVELLKQSKLDVGRKYITSIVRVDSVPTKCIQVEGDLYVVGDRFTTTHNSTILTFGLTIQEILKDPNITIGIFSTTRAIAKKFLEQIKTELENNRVLIDLFPEIFHSDPNKYPKWSADNGLTIKRTTNPKESTIECGGIIEGMPTGRHYGILVYDDMVTEQSISTPDMIEKTLSQWELSLNLGYEYSKYRYIGTRYGEKDLYEEMIRRGVVTPRIRVGITPEGQSLLWSPEFAKQRRDDMGPRTWSTQILQDPTGEGNAEFNISWLKYYSLTGGHNKLNKYMVVDPASTKSRRSDYTAVIVFGVGADNNYYIIDMIRDKLNLSERAKIVFDLVEKYRPIRVGYEKYGMNNDIDHMKYMMEQEQFRFEIVPLGGLVKKEDRIRRLVPLFEQGRLYLPYHKELEHVNFEGRIYFPVNNFMDEYDKFPYSAHDDLIDAMARIIDAELKVRMPSSDDSRNRVKQYKQSVFGR